mgnify:CR=1 FL=1
MENGNGLNPGQHANSQQEYGYLLDQGVLILPVSEMDSIYYYLIHLDKELPDGIHSFYSKNFYCTVINHKGYPNGKVIKKNKVIQQDIYELGKITSTRHANGRDWWILLRKYNTNRYYRFLVTPKGILNYGIQSIGIPIPSPGVGQAVFSPDGTKFANVHIGGGIGSDFHIAVYNFDRCTGELSRPVQWTYADSAWAGGVAISPNSRFLYVPSFKYLYQYDLWADDIPASKDTIAVWDGFFQPPGYSTTFYLAQLAPDGKIYINDSKSAFPAFGCARPCGGEPGFIRPGQCN